LRDDQIQDRIDNPEAFAPLVSGVFTPTHMASMGPTGFVVFSFLVLIQNRKQAPLGVADVAGRQVARFLGLGSATAIRALKRLENEGYISKHHEKKQQQGWLIKKARTGKGRRTKSDPKMDHPRSANGSEVIQKRITSDPPADHPRSKNGSLFSRSNGEQTTYAQTEAVKKSEDVVKKSEEEKEEVDASSLAPIAPRYRRAPTDFVWFLADDTLTWTPEIPTELQNRFPARTRQIERRGKTWLDELRGLSNWHSEAPPSKKKRSTAQRWLFGTKFWAEERSALHAEKFRPASAGIPKAHEGMIGRDMDERAQDEARIEACPRDHDRERVKSATGRKWMCPGICGWYERVIENEKVGA